MFARKISTRREIWTVICKWKYYLFLDNFSYSEFFWISRLTHSGQRDFSCPLCSKKFQEKCGVRRHLKTVHKHMVEVRDGCIAIKTEVGESTLY